MYQDIQLYSYSKKGNKHKEATAASGPKHNTLTMWSITGFTSTITLPLDFPCVYLKIMKVNKKPNTTKNCKENETIKANLRHPLKSKIWRVFLLHYPPNDGMSKHSPCPQIDPATKLWHGNGLGHYIKSYISRQILSKFSFIIVTDKIIFVSD